MRILIAEDSVVSRAILQSLLARWGYEVVVTCDGAEALDRMLEPDAPRVAVLDWEMPRLDGVEVCARIRAAAAFLQPYLLLVTGRDSKEDMIAGLQSGADDYVTKPFNEEELRARVRTGGRIVGLQDALAGRVSELESALAHIRTLQGILPICMFCHKIRDDQASWQRVEEYIASHSEATFSHGICPDCMRKHYAEYAPAAPPGIA